MTRPLRSSHWWLLYKLGDAFAVSLSTIFLLRGVGLSLSDIGLTNKGLALVATILGALVGGALMARLGLFRSLLLFGALQAVSNLTCCVLALAGKSYALAGGGLGGQPRRRHGQRCVRRSC